MNISLSAPASPAGWQHSIHQYIELRPTHVIKFSVNGASWGCCVKADGTNHWLVGLDASNKPTVEKYNGSTYTQVTSRVTTYSGAMDVIVQFSEIRFGSSNDLWHTVAMWINGIHVINYCEPQGSALAIPLKFGLAVRAGGGVTFSNVKIPQLGEMAEVATLDTGETSAGGLQRTIEGRYLKYQVRQQGQLHAWRSEPMGQSYMLDEHEGMSEDVHTNQIKTHVRMVGAYDYAEYVDDTLISDYSYSFVETNNPYLMSEEDCKQEAKNEIRRRLEGSISGNVTNSAMHFLEVEDGLGVEGNARLINGLTLSYRGPQVEHRVDYRKDAWLNG